MTSTTRRCAIATKRRPDAKKLVADPPAAFSVLPVSTRWFERDDQIATALEESLPALTESDTVVISEKVAVLLTGRGVPIDEYPARPLARLLSRAVRPPAGSRGLSIPEKMQYVVEKTGAPRILAAALASAITRPFGVRGTFYRVAGPLARDLDGGRPPYEDLLLPPFAREEADELCGSLDVRLGCGVALIDVNDLGGSIRGTSPRSLPIAALREALRDNPLGQRLTGTPFGVVRRIDSGTT